MTFASKSLAVIVGSLILAIGINFFLVPLKILDGGVIGIGLIIHYIWGVKVGFTIILFSIPIFVYAWFKCRHYFYNSLHGVLVSSFLIDLLEPFQHSSRSYVQLSVITSSMIGGILVGLGIGIKLRHETSTGGQICWPSFFPTSSR